MRSPVSCPRLALIVGLLSIWLGSAGCRFSPHIEDGVVACDPGADSCPPGLMCVQRSPTLAVYCREPGCPGINVAINRDAGADGAAPTDATNSPDGGDQDVSPPDDARPTDAAVDRPADAPPPTDAATDRPADLSPDSASDVLLPPDVMPPLPCERRACSGAISDQCCPLACGPVQDVDCPGCGNGRVEGEREETCDPPGSCPTSCPALSCTRRVLVGSPATCNARCMNERISACVAGDNCCPDSCNATNDPECGAVCDNGTLEPGETCEPRTECARRDGACNSDTDTMRTRTGDVARCTFVCSEMPRPCVTGDGFCPVRCTPSTDSDCTGCGNGRVEGAETCDPPIACLEQQARCVSDASTVRTGVGEPGACSFRCQEAPRGCTSGDGFCPAGCNGSVDTDCAGCGNGRLEPGETCDPPSACLTQQAMCVGDASTVRTGSGNPGACTFVCQSTPRTCTTGDGFCPAGCTRASDRDCKATNGEACNGNGECLSSVCEDGRCCQVECARCQACTGAGGSCVAILNAPDPGPCDGNRICDGAGMCIPRNMLP
jgi:hypothetical protein